MDLVSPASGTGILGGSLHRRPEFGQPTSAVGIWGSALHTGLQFGQVSLAGLWTWTRLWVQIEVLFRGGHTKSQSHL